MCIEANLEVDSTRSGLITYFQYYVLLRNQNRYALAYIDNRQSNEDLIFHTEKMRLLSGMSLIKIFLSLLIRGSAAIRATRRRNQKNFALLNLEV